MRSLALLIMVAASSAFAQPESYDTLGPLDSGLNPAPVLRQVRAFVARHWRQHRRGYAEFTLYSKEGEPTTSQLYIEPDASGRWQIRGTSHSIQSDRRPLGDPKKQPDRHVRRRFVAVSMRLEDGSLILKDHAGKEVCAL
jgi:hypothetical protein